MVWDDIAEAEQNLAFLIDAELEIHHRLEGHERVMPGCPVCRANGARPSELVRC